MLFSLLFHSNICLLTLCFTIYKVVEDVSSSVGYAAEVKETIDADHREMCQFASKTDPGYIKVSRAIIKYVNNGEKQRM